MVGIFFLPPVAEGSDLLAEADRLAALRVWTRAEPLYAKAQAEFAARGDQRNAIYAEVSKLRGQMQKHSVGEMSLRFGEFLENPIVQADDRLKLQCLVVKGDADLDYDPALAERTWTEAKELARKLGDPFWENRADGELGIIAALLGRPSDAIRKMGDARKRAEQLGDVSSEVRWITVFGQGFISFGMYDQALAYLDKALEKARAVPEIEFPVLTYTGKAEALIKSKRLAEAKALIQQTLAGAREKEAFGYQAELTRHLANIAVLENDPVTAIRLLEEARDFAKRSGGPRVLLEVTADLAAAQHAANRFDDERATLASGIESGRANGDRFIMPRLLKQYADLQLQQNRTEDAAELLGEAADHIEGLLAHTSSPWIKSRLIASMNDVFAARIQLEGATRKRPDRLFEIVEQARGRVLADMMLSRPVSEIAKRADLRAAELRLAKLQSKLMMAKGARERASILREILVTEAMLGPGVAELFTASRRTSPREPVSMNEAQEKLGTGEALLQYAFGEEESFCLALTRNSAAIHRIGPRKGIESKALAMIGLVKEGKDLGDTPAKLGAILLGMPEVRSAKRLIVNPDGVLHRLPFDLLTGPAGQPLLETHIVQKIPSVTVLTLLRSRPPASARRSLAVSAAGTSAQPVPIGQVNRGLYDLDGTDLPPLPSANDEARAVASLLGRTPAKTLLGDQATEGKLKAEPLDQYRVLHFAAHGLTSTKQPERSAVILRTEAGAADDGLLQAREILELKLNAALVTLSACETGSGSVQGQEGVSSLVRPFLAAGARSVVANLWPADDTFSLTIMKEFYRGLGAGLDISTALQQAKRTVVKQFGSQASPKLWAGLEVHGDGREMVTRQ